MFKLLLGDDGPSQLMVLVECCPAVHEKGTDHYLIKMKGSFQIMQ